MPLAVITAGRQDNFLSAPTGLGRALKRLWDTMQDELGGLSHNSVHVVALDSNHDVTHSGQQSVVIRTVQAWSAPPATTRLFHPAGVWSTAPTFAARSETRRTRSPSPASRAAAGHA
jgi:hypothetical protein